MSIWSGEAVETGTPLLEAGANAPFGWLRFNNPDKRNAISLEMWAGMQMSLETLAARDDVRVLVLSGAGGKAFASGADISQFEKDRSTQEGAKRYAEISGGGGRALAEFPRPTIAMIEGYCMGGGLATALNCDLRIAAEGSTFAIPAARLGVGYPSQGVAALVDLVGPAYTREILYTARRYSGEEALRMGLINRLAPAGELVSLVEEYAQAIAINAPLSIASAKTAVREILKTPELRNLAAVEETVATCFNSDDYKEGRRAFMEKRIPDFKRR